MHPLISSLQNERVKAVVKLRDRKGRNRENLFVIDGEREIALALNAGVAVRQLYIPAECSREVERLAHHAAANDAEIFPVSPSVMEKLAYGDRRQSVVAVAVPPDVSLAAFARAMESKSQPPLFLVLDRVEKPGNVGAAARSADAVGATGVLLSDGATDLFNPNVVRASRGAVFTLPFAEADGAASVAWLRERNVTLFAARTDGAVNYTECDFRGPTAFILGSEAEGLGSAWRGADITAVRLPMHGAADSLNVSVTAAVLLFEALRQRSIAG